VLFKRDISQRFVEIIFGYELRHGFNAVEHDVSLKLHTISPLVVRAVQIVQEADRAEILVELEVVVVVELRRLEEGPMVAWVAVQGLEGDVAEPKPGGERVRAQNRRP